jgi:hypothetical protein
MWWMAPLRHLSAKLLSDRISSEWEPSMGEVSTTSSATAFTYCADISRTSWPSARNSRRARLQANQTGRHREAVQRPTIRFVPVKTRPYH